MILAFFIIALLAAPALADGDGLDANNATLGAAGGLVAITYMAKTIFELVKAQKREKETGQHVSTIEHDIESIISRIAAMLAENDRRNQDSLREIASATTMIAAALTTVTAQNEAIRAGQQALHLATLAGFAAAQANIDDVEKAVRETRS